jgi:hypothetical protein
LQRGPAFVAQCQEWVRALTQGDYAYAVVGPDQRTQSVAPVEAFWTVAAGGTIVETNDDVWVFKIDRSLDPAGCVKAEKSRGVVRGQIDAGNTPLSQ